MIQLWKILVPTVRNSGRPFRTRHHRVWDSKVRAITGGLTIFKPAKGQWISQDNKLYEERMIPVLIACTSDQIEKIADITAKHYEQLAVFYYLVSSKVVINQYDPDKKFTRK